LLTIVFHILILFFLAIRYEKKREKFHPPNLVLSNFFGSLITKELNWKPRVVDPCSLRDLPASVADPIIYMLLNKPFPPEQSEEARLHLLTLGKFFQDST
jgi:hypothetical protein